MRDLVLHSFLIPHVTQTVTHRLFSKLFFKNIGKNNHLDIINGALGRIRTCDRSVRSRVLYPAELRVRFIQVRQNYMAPVSV